MSFGSRVFVDCWMWKCVAGKEDPRRKWRIMYDNGEIVYNYEYKNSEECFVHFRVKAWYAYIEVLCTDSRCPGMTYYQQRVNEMRNIPVNDIQNFFVMEDLNNPVAIYRSFIARRK